MFSRFLINFIRHIFIMNTVPGKVYDATIKLCGYSIPVHRFSLRFEILHKQDSFNTVIISASNLITARNTYPKPRSQCNYNPKANILIFEEI